MKKRTGKMISLSLAVAMAVTAAPVTALADESVQASTLTTAQNTTEPVLGTTLGEQDEQGNGSTEKNKSAKTVATQAELETALTEASEDDTITITTSFEITKPIVIDKAVTVTANEGVVLTAKGDFSAPSFDPHVFRLYHADAVLDNVAVVIDGSNSSNVNIVYLHAGTVQNCNFTGSGANDNPVTRGVIVESGAKNVVIKDNVFNGFFASAYINSGATGNIIDNESKNTEESWCIADGSNMDLTGNTFEGTTTIDIKIFADFPSQTNKYTKEKFLAMSENNSSARIQNIIDDVTALNGSIIVSDKDSLEKAIAYADATETPIALQADITGDFVIDKDKNVSLDLNGYKITNTSDHTITNNGTLTIKDSSEKTGTIDNVTHARAAVWNNGNAILEGGTYTRSSENGINKENSGGNSYYNIVNHNHMTIKSGVTVKQDGNFSSMIENGWYNGNQNTAETPSIMIIEGGTFSGGLNTVKNDDYGELTINDGTFSNISQAAFLNWNTATINGGNFEVNDNAEAVIMNAYANSSMDKGELTINGGNFNTDQKNINFLKTAEISGYKHTGSVEINGGNIYGNINLNDISKGTSMTISNDVIIDGSISNQTFADINITNATVTGSVSNAGTGSVVISDGATVEGAVSNTGSGSMAVIESRIGRYTSGQNITFVDSTTTNDETIENTQDVSAACARIGAKYYNTLEQALTESKSGDTITLVKDVTVSNTQDMANSYYNEAVITLQDGVTLDGDTHTIHASKSWFNSTAGKNANNPANHLVGVSGVSATIKNLTIVGNENTKHGINAYGVNGNATLNISNVTIKNCGTAGMVINGAKVTATNINTEGNPWGAINVDKSSGSELDLTGGTFKENVQIWTESDDPNISLDGVQLDEVTGEGTNLKGFTYFTDDVSKLGTAYNETTKTIYESLADALTAAQSGNTISVVKDTELTTNAIVDNNVTLVVNPDVTLSIVEGTTLTNNGTIENKGEIKGKVTGEITEYYTVTFTSNKEIESVEVKDKNNDVVRPNVEGKFVYSLANGTYTYTMETVRGTRTGSFTVNGEDKTINENFSSGGGSSHSYDGYITIINPKNGEVSVSDDWAYEDDKITLTITPDDGYEVDKIEIVDDEGDKIDAKKVDDEDNKYTFRMANCDVTVTVTFKEEGKTTEDTDKEEDKDDESTETTELNFTDVKESDWFFKGVEYVVDKGVMSGVSENEFAPAGKLTRAMLVQMLYNMESRPACDAENAFMDVPVGQWYTDAVIWANDAKIVSGMGEGLFAPNMEITREQMVAMLYNYAKYKGYDVTASADLSAFADTASVSAWAQPAMQWAVAEGYISGMGDNQLAPQGTATRAEIASVIMRFMEATAETAE